MKRESKLWQGKLWHGHPARVSLGNTHRVFGGLLLITALLISSLSAFAQQKPATEQRAVVVSQQRVIQGPDDPQHPLPPDTVFFVGTEMNFDGKLVKGAPYSAQAITETIQTLGDGNRIINKSTATIYRDSEGRTRREQTLGAVGPFPIDGDAPQTISISDPVAGVNYALDPRTKTAHKMKPMQFKFKIMSPDGEKAPPADSMTLRVGPEQRSEMRLERSPAPPGTTQRSEVLIEKIPAPGGAPERGEMRIERTPPPPGTPGEGVEMHPEVFIRHAEGMGMAGTGGMVMTWKAGAGKDAKQESLGKQVIEGIEAEGSRTTFTIPAGSVGNERAIEMVNERWYSPELQVVVMTRHSDPRFGETTYRLTNINRSEQPKSLFEVPADYTVREPRMDLPGSKMRMKKPGIEEQ